jgi:hypothetical protein
MLPSATERYRGIRTLQFSASELRQRTTPPEVYVNQEPILRLFELQRQRCKILQRN